MHLPSRFLRTVLLLGSLSVTSLAAAQPGPALPDWDRLTPEQRDQLVAPIRDRWNDADADKRRRMLGHAQRWQSMTPAEREHARHGMHSWKRLPPEQREEARALYAKLRTLPDAERTALRERWQQMTPEQRRHWAQANPAPEPHDEAARPPH
ncbi:DUF3106 domain-containing protein [Luteimonas sp. TWI1437]|uniref:DUF3106 domain-containing protein n=1 Tax=unclassified Luteimonas TaxID=2629088 RepID=UPI003209E6B3